MCLPWSRTKSTIQFTVEENTKISKLSGELDKEGIVNYGLIFKLFLTVTNKNEDVLAGTYELSPAMDYNQIVLALRNADKKQTVEVTIPEGYSLHRLRKRWLKIMFAPKRIWMRR